MALLLGEGDAEEILKRDGKVQIKCGPCMEPTFRKGQITSIVPTTRVVTGMVALIRAGRGYVLHRILKIIPPWAVHGGDGTDLPGICRISEIVGIPVFQSVEVISGSMSPTIPPGSRVSVEQTTPQTGDVALIWGEKIPQVHRVLGESGNWVIHAGDGSPTAGIAAKSDIVGRVHVPCPPHLPAARHAHALALLLKIAAVLHRVGIPSVGPLKSGMGLLKKLLSRCFLRR